MDSINYLFERPQTRSPAGVALVSELVERFQGRGHVPPNWSTISGEVADRLAGRGFERHEIFEARLALAAWLDTYAPSPVRWMDIELLLAAWGAAVRRSRELARQ